MKYFQLDSCSVSRSIGAPSFSFMWYTHFQGAASFLIYRAICIAARQTFWQFSSASSSRLPSLHLLRSDLPTSVEYFTSLSTGGRLRTFRVVAYIDSLDSLHLFGPFLSPFIPPAAARPPSAPCLGGTRCVAPQGDASPGPGQTLTSL